MKHISAGIIITDMNCILLGHSTGNDYWDIPKGIVEKGEDYKETAIRETIEEFGLDFSNQNLIELGLMNYTPSKDLYLFLVIVDDMPDTETCKCDSYFELNGKQYPEIDDYKIIHLDECIHYTNKYMSPILYKLDRKLNYD